MLGRRHRSHGKVNLKRISQQHLLALHTPYPGAQDDRRAVPAPEAQSPATFNITVIQAYAPTSNAEEAEVEWFYEDLQDILDSRAEGLLFLHGLESNPGSSLQTEEEAGLP